MADSDLDWEKNIKGKITHVSGGKLGGFSNQVSDLVNIVVTVEKDERLVILPITTKSDFERKLYQNALMNSDVAYSEKHSFNDEGILVYKELKILSGLMKDQNYKSIE